jgi:hypothetical protein
LSIWIAAGDETGGWDIVDGTFSTNFTGLAWALGSLSAWDKALQMNLSGVTALEVFSQPISTRVPEDTQQFESSKKYHLLDVWRYCSRNALKVDIHLEAPQSDPVLELLRLDADWLLRQSGLGILAVGGNAGDTKAAGLGRSGDGLRERARAYAGLFTVALPFLPGDASVNFLVEGRTEQDIAEAVRANRYVEPQIGNDNRIRYLEPYRDFTGRLTEDLIRASDKCKVTVIGGEVASEFSCKGRKGMSDFLSKVRGAPFLQANAAEAVKAMNGIADLAAALIPQPENKKCRLVVPTNFSENHWTGNFRDLREATYG